MDKKNFIQILRNPKEISENELDELEIVVSQYPYFQTARAILASGSKALGKSDSGKKLGTAAIYTTNRNLLKRYVFETLDFSQSGEIKVGAATYSTNDNDRNDDNTRKRKKFIFVERKEEITERTGKGKFIDLTKKSDEDEEDYLVVSESITTGDSIDWEAKIANQESVENQKSTQKEIETTSRKIVARKPEEFTQLPSRVNNDELVDEVFKNLEEYQKRKNHYTEVEQKILDLEETEAVNDAILKANERLKTNTEPQENTKHKLASDKSKLAESEINAEVNKIEDIKIPSIQPKEQTESSNQKNDLEFENRATASEVEHSSFKPKEDRAEFTAKESNTTQNESKSKENDFEVYDQKVEFKESEKKSITSISKETEIEKAEPKSPIKDESESYSQKYESEKDSTNSNIEEDKDDDSFAKMVADIKKSSTFQESPVEAAQPKVTKSKTISPKSGKIEKQSAIIESFIKANPKIVPSEEDNNNEIKDLSVDSTHLKDGLATENLAKIFLKQGKREKAIEIYEQLILINPDKKSYFASQISKLK